MTSLQQYQNSTRPHWLRGCWVELQALDPGDMGTQRGSASMCFVRDPLPPSGGLAPHPKQKSVWPSRKTLYQNRRPNLNQTTYRHRVASRAGRLSSLPRGLMVLTGAEGDEVADHQVVQAAAQPRSSVDGRG